MKKIFHLPFNIFQNGFTLIELMVTISITAVLGTLGIAGFVNYNKVQVLQTSTSEVVTMLNLAKSRAQSQIKPSGLCVGNDLSGYSVKISKDANNKWWNKLYLNCSDERESLIDEQNKKLPASLSFDANNTFFFPVQTGGVDTSGIIVISYGGSSRTITINSLGGVGVQ